MRRPKHLRRGIYLLPTLFTLGNLFCGFSSVAQSSRAHFEQAALLIILAAILDGLDGRIARLTGTTSEFGLEFDSMADIVSFGVAPAMLCFHWGLNGRLGWVVAFLFVVSAAMRLARFNLQTSVTDRRFFVGLPSPMAGSALAAVVFAFPSTSLSGIEATFLAGMLFLVASLMLSRLRYRSFKDLDLRNRRSYIYALPLAAILVAVITHPQAALLVLSAAYVFSGPARSLWGLLRRGGSRDRSTAEPGLADDSPLR